MEDFEKILARIGGTKPAVSTADDFEGTLSKISKPSPVVPATRATPSSGLQFDLTRDGRERFIPQNNTWSLKSGAPSIQNWYQTQYKKPLPVKNFGQSKFETSVGWNHEDAMDVGINPTTSEGQALISYLRENNIPYQAFSRAIYKNGRTVSTGPHIHIGLPSPSLSRVPLGSRRVSQPQSAIPTTPVAQPSMPASVGAEPSQQIPEEMRADRTLTRPRLATRVQANPRGMLETGNTDLYRRLVVKNRDGSISTVRSMSVNIDGQEVLIPTVSDDGRILSDDEAIEQYKQTGKFLGKFDSPENATTYAKALHNAQAKQYAAPEGTIERTFTPGQSYFLAGDAQLPLTRARRQGEQQTGQAYTPDPVTVRYQEGAGEVVDLTPEQQAQAVTGRGRTVTQPTPEQKQEARRIYSQRLGVYRKKLAEYKKLQAVNQRLNEVIGNETLRAQLEADPISFELAKRGAVPLPPKPTPPTLQGALAEVFKKKDRFTFQQGIDLTPRAQTVGGVDISPQTFGGLFDFTC